MSAFQARLLEGRRGLILGVGSENSVGYQTALAFSEMGARVGITYRPGRRERGAYLAEKHGFAHHELEASDETSIERAIISIGNDFGQLDFLVHTLVSVPEGVLKRPVTQVSAQEFSHVMDVSVRSLLAACRYAQPYLEKSDAARVVALVSSGGDFAMPNYHVVGIAKAALGAAVRYVAQELGPRGILCNALGFSIIATDAANRVIGKDETLQTHGYLAKRSMTRTALEFAHVTSALAFFSSPLCRNVTGEALTVDGGFSRSYF